MAHKVGLLKYLRKQNDDVRGSVMLECAISLLVLILLCIGVVSLGAMLTDYLKLVQVADEAVRTLSGIPGIEPDTNVTWSDLKAAGLPALCEQSAAASPKCGHVLAQSRIIFLCQTLNLNTDNIAITSEYMNTADTVRIRIVLPFNGVFDLFGNIPLTVEAEGPYLFEGTGS